MSKYKEVTREVFKEYMEAYPNTIRTDYNQIVEPPRMVYHDGVLLEEASSEEEYYDSIIGYMDNNKVYNEPNVFKLRDNE